MAKLAIMAGLLTTIESFFFLGGGVLHSMHPDACSILRVIIALPRKMRILTALRGTTPSATGGMLEVRVPIRIN